MAIHVKPGDPNRCRRHRKDKVRNRVTGEMVCPGCIAEQHYGELVGKTSVGSGKDNKPLAYNFDQRVLVKGKLTKEALLDKIKQVAQDPTLFCELRMRVDRPAGVSKERFGVASHAAAKIPMLNADANQSARGLGVFDPRGANPKLPKLRSEVVLKVKPTTSQTAKAGRNSSFWGVRLWRISSLKYTHGYVITSDLMEDSKPFHSIGQALAAIRKSGWEIVK